MCNNCNNILIIKKLSEEDKQELFEKYAVIEENSRVLVFNNIIPLPENRTCEIAHEAWGTKWEPLCSWMGEEENPEGEKGEKQTYFIFDTAWSAPIEVIRELSKLFPKAIFNIAYFEPGIGFMGEKTFEAGEETYSMYSEDEAEMRKAYPEHYEGDEE